MRGGRGDRGLSPGRLTFDHRLAQLMQGHECGFAADAKFDRPRRANNL